MKKVKGLLLGSAAGLAAVSGTQAADLPVKAKPVQYVKICSLYGEGFYYIPGSDICLKIGGYVRADYGWNVRGARTPNYTGAGGAHDRTVSPYSTRHRAHFNFDSRTQTAYGTLRTYVAIHIDNENQGTVTINPTRAFIQWAGFTFGHTKSFTDVPGAFGDDTFKSLHQTQNQSDTGANGTNQIAYTWELGNGMTLNVGADERRTKAIANLSNNVTTVGTNPNTSFGPYQHPTPWVNFAVNQAWGRFGVSAIFNKVNATYYTGTLADTGACPGTATGTSACNSPDDKWGWAVLSGIDIKAPWAGPGDHFGGYFNYGVGAAAYAGGSNLSSPGLFGSGNNVALGVITDGVLVNGGQFDLTTTWTAGAGWEHFWLPNFSTAVYGTYTQVRYSDDVINSRLFCGNAGSLAVNQNVIVSSGVSCDPGFNYWTVGMVNNWYPVAGFRLAVDVLYTRIETAFEGQTISLNKTVGLRPTGSYTAKDQGILSVVFRAQRSFATGD
ncbi:MAG TPA: porin [Vicinamibacterales bacterium]|nr:porin [Vicinamibacterales bacterium]